MDHLAQRRGLLFGLHLFLLHLLLGLLLLFLDLLFIGDRAEPPAIEDATRLLLALDVRLPEAASRTRGDAWARAGHVAPWRLTFKLPPLAVAPKAQAAIVARAGAIVRGAPALAILEPRGRRRRRRRRRARLGRWRGGWLGRGRRDSAHALDVLGLKGARVPGSGRAGAIRRDVAPWNLAGEFPPSALCTEAMHALVPGATAARRGNPSLRAEVARLRGATLVLAHLGALPSALALIVHVAPRSVMLRLPRVAIAAKTMIIHKARARAELLAHAWPTNLRGLEERDGRGTQGHNTKPALWGGAAFGRHANEPVLLAHSKVFAGVGVLDGNDGAVGDVSAGQRAGDQPAHHDDKCQRWQNGQEQIGRRSLAAHRGLGAGVCAARLGGGVTGVQQNNKICCN